MSDAPSHSLRERLAGLAAFLPMLQATGFEFGRWGGGEKTASGAIQMPYYVLGDEAAALVQAAYDLGWVLPDFGWPAWKETPEAIKLRDDSKALAEATAEQLARLLTVLIRQDRFVEGGLAGAFDSGLLTAIIARSEALTNKGWP